MKSILPFLAQLKAHNNREWFLANKKSYEKAKGELSDYLTGLIAGISAFDPSIASLQPKDCIFRINRDIRFSNDKSPYKTNMGAVIAPGGRKSRYGCYYVHIDPDGSFLAGGIYMPENDVLGRIRQEIDYNLKEFEGILKNNKFSKHFSGIDEMDRLKTAPKGYATDNPAINYLKNKSFTVSKVIKPAELISATFEKQSLEVFRELKKLNDFLNRAIDKD